MAEDEESWNLDDRIEEALEAFSLAHEASLLGFGLYDHLEGGG